MVRRRADVRREEILAAAAAAVSRRGFAGTRVADVAADLGISSGLVFYHFDTKERLLSEAFGYAAARDLDRLDRAVARPGTAVARLRAVLRLYQPSGHAPGWTLDIEAWAEAQRTPEIREASRELDRRWRAAIEQVVRDGIRDREFEVDDPAAAVLKITALLDGLAVATQVRGSLSRKDAVRWAAEHAAQVLDLHPAVLATGRTA
jgi:AcrR family transcriptional regulator